MGDNPSGPHLTRSAELQRLLDEAALQSVAPAAQLTVHRLPAQHEPADRTLLPPPSRRKPDSSFNATASPSADPTAGTAGGRPAPQKRSASPADRVPTQRSPLQSSPPSTFPRRVGPTVPNSTGTPAAAPRRAESAAGPADRLRRSALVRTPISGSGVRRKSAEHGQPPGAEGGRPRIAPEEEGRRRAGNRAVGTTRRSSGKAVSPSTKTAVTRALAGRWGAAGFVPEQPGYRPAFDAQKPEQQRRVQPAVAPGDLAGSTRDRPPTPRKPVVDRRPAGAAPAVSTPPPERKLSTALPPATDRARQRRPLVVAGGVAAAVVAVVAILSIGNRGGSKPAADATPNPAKVVTVQSIGADGSTAMMTVTAPVSTVNGAVVALVPGANGQVQRLMVVTATPPAPATASPTPRSTAAAPRSTVRQVVGGATATSSSSTPAQPATASKTRSSDITSAAATPTPAPTVGPAPADPGDVATVVTGLTTLTGWVPVTTR